MNLHNMAAEAAEKQSRNEAQAFEQAMRRVTSKPICDDIRIEQIAAHYGFTSQADILTEECAEYMVALSKLRRGRAEAYENIKEEVADVLIMARQLRYLLGYEDIDKIIEAKLDRQMRRIEDEVS